MTLLCPLRESELFLGPALHPQAKLWKSADTVHSTKPGKQGNCSSDEDKPLYVDTECPLTE